jgi:uncharacterized membrane protein YeiH
MDQAQIIYYSLDLAGTFAFAVSGATAARSGGLIFLGYVRLHLP